jgi:predicted dehydrogenase
LIWCNDIALGGGHHVNACIHAIDGGLWLAGQRPVSAVGLSRIARAQPHGDSHDIISVSFEFADGVVWNHGGKHLNNQQPFEVAVIAQGTTGFAQVTYGGKATLRSRENAYSGDVANVYEAGAIRNIAAFYQQVTEGKFENLTVPRAVDGVLTTILCREATMRRVRLTMAELLKENKRIEVNVKGLKA